MKKEGREKGEEGKGEEGKGEEGKGEGEGKGEKGREEKGRRGKERGEGKGRGREGKGWKRGGGGVKGVKKGGDEDQLTTDTTDLEMTEKTLAEDTAAFEDITQDCLVCQMKVADFEAYNKSLSGIEGAKAKDVISEETDDFEHRDNQSMLSSSGGSTIELIRSENSIGLTQLATETSNGDDPFVNFKGLISDMIWRLEEKAGV